MTTYTRPVVNGTPTTGQVVKAAHVNEPIDQIYDTILAGGITADQIAAGAVDTAELATAAVTAAKMDGTLPDASAMATSAAPTTDAQLANKKYVDEVDSADDFTPSAYTGEESVTFPNGLIFKQGEESVAADTVDTVTFGVAFPTAATNGQTTLKTNSTDEHESPHCLVSTTTIQIVNDKAATRTIYWQAWGY